MKERKNKNKQRKQKGKEGRKEGKNEENNRKIENGRKKEKWTTGRQDPMSSNVDKIYSSKILTHHSLESRFKWLNWFNSEDS